MGSLEGLAVDLDREGAAGLLFGSYSPRVGESGGFALGARDQDAVVDRLQRMGKEHAFVLNAADSLEIMRPAYHRAVEATRLYRAGSPGA